MCAALIAGEAATLAASDKPVPLPSKSEKWIEVRTKNFTLYGNASESKTTDVGLEMERLRAVLVALKRGSPIAPVPTWIYVFKNPAALEAYLPVEDEKPVRASSYYMGGWDGNYAMLSAAWNDDPRPTVYHSYIYDFIDANFVDLPLWYEVGIAGYYSTFQTSGKEVRTGMVHEDYLERLRSRGMWISLDLLLAANRDSPVYRDPDTKGLFFAESWALVHYLSQGTPERVPQLGRYMRLCAQGRPQDDAFREAFGTDYATLYGELVAYIRNNKRFFFNRLMFQELRPPTEARATSMSHEDVVIRLGDLLAHMRRFEEAEWYYESLLASNPSSAGALGGLAWVRQRQERKGEAAALWRRAAAAGSTDFRVYFWEGRHCWDEIGPVYDPNDTEKRALLEAARAAFRQSAELNPGFAEALAMLGRTYRFEPRGASLDEGIAALEEAKKRLPTRDDVASDLALLRQREGKSDRADALGAAAGSRAAATALPASPEPPRSAAAPTPVPGSRAEKAVASAKETAGTDKVNALLSQGKEDEAVAAMEELAAYASSGMRAYYQDELKKLKAGVARNKAVRAYNAAIALYNRHDYAAALPAFEKLAASSPETEWGRRAAERAAEIRKILGK